MSNGPPREVFQILHDRPDIFTEKIFGDSIWTKQREVLQSIATHQKTAVKSCHGAGKSFTAARAVIWYLCTRRPAEVITTAPTWRQVEEILWKEIRLAWGRAIPDIQALGNCLNTELKFGDGHHAYGMSTDKTDRFQGIHSPNLMVVVDEAAGVSQAIFDAIATLGTGGEYRELLIGNPTSTNGRFYNAFQNPAYGYNCISIRADDTPNFTGELVPPIISRNVVTPQWAADRALEWGIDSTLYRSRVDAEFPDGDEDNILIPLSWAEDACNREPREDGNAIAQMGLDVARYGSDSCVIAGRVGYNLLQLDTLSGKTGSLEVEAWARRNAQDYSAKHGKVVVMVDEGYNPGIVDHLQALHDDNISYEAVSFGASATDPEAHINKRNEMLWGLRELFRTGNSDPDICIPISGPAVERFKSQISAMRFSYDTRLRPKVESKEDMRKRGMPSPDESDAVALAFIKGRPALAYYEV